MKRRTRNAFTLVELLVVVAIILALLAILLPSMGKAIEAANRAVCASQQHQIGTALLQYAGDTFGNLPPANATVLPGWGRPSNYQVTSNTPLGHGYLEPKGYLPTAEIQFCPSWSHPTYQYDTIDVPGADGWFGPGQIGGWPAPGNPGPTAARCDSYYYRSSFIGSDGLANDPPSLRQHASGSAILADEWTYREVLYGPTYGHVEGYMALYLDGGTRWVAISGEELKSIFPAVSNGGGGWWYQHEVQVWEPMFDRR